MTTPLELVQYYADLLVKQYRLLPKATAHVKLLVSQAIMCQTTTQDITFSAVAASGSFVLSWVGLGYNSLNNAATVNWNDSASTIQASLRALTGLSTITVAGSIASQTLTMTFTGVIPPADLLVVSSNTLMTSAPAAITIDVEQTDEVLPLAVQDAFNIDASLGPVAVGVQLDILGKYQGVVRSGQGFNGPVTLNDADFLSLIQIAIVKNAAGSDLNTIQTLLFQLFAGEVLVFDYRSMRISYLISSTVGSQSLIQLVVREGLLPRPMGVGMSVIYYADITKFFGFVTYDNQVPFNNTPFNTYDSYNMDSPWLSYNYAVSAP